MTQSLRLLPVRRFHMHTLPSRAAAATTPQPTVASHATTESSKPPSCSTISPDFVSQSRILPSSLQLTSVASWALAAYNIACCPRDAWSGTNPMQETLSRWPDSVVSMACFWRSRRRTVRSRLAEASRELLKMIMLTSLVWSCSTSTYTHTCTHILVLTHTHIHTGKHNPLMSKR